MKTILAPGFKARMLGVEGWYSTNILGNRDGEVLDDPDSFKAKEVSKLGVLDTIFQPERYPDLYGDIHHVVRINYYPPRGDNKEGWDNIDIFGWLGYKMQIKVDFLCRDSILAAPLVLDLALFLDLASRAGLSGVQEWLSFYWKSPQPAQPGPLPGARPLHPADEAEEHPPPPHGRRPHHPPGRRVLRLSLRGHSLRSLLELRARCAAETQRGGLVPRRRRFVWRPPTPSGCAGHRRGRSASVPWVDRRSR